MGSDSLVKHRCSTDKVSVFFSAVCLLYPDVVTTFFSAQQLTNSLSNHISLFSLFWLFVWHYRHWQKQMTDKKLRSIIRSTLRWKTMDWLMDRRGTSHWPKYCSIPITQREPQEWWLVFPIPPWCMMSCLWTGHWIL